ncbi:hypothetical protein PACTADRAFT_47682 [Pachysolen tannophilus NRRL Y-2460]|uniref:Glycosyltransferase family 91 protein n=1 Tax=Pachysolen tannophilus NRRL Y-2460 TaxID=669874 RepID=A0A1E4U1F6_PACTA|nr:hypothetical protein PACTADRAFT_47682 [Pachysolen tannophilus NRRL Y-2460]
MSLIIRILLCILLVSVFYIVSYTHLIAYNKKRKRKILAALGVALLLTYNLNTIIDNVEYYRLSFTKYKNIPESSPLSIPVINAEYTRYNINGYSFKANSITSNCQNLEVQSNLQVTRKYELVDDMYSIRRRISQMLLKNSMFENCFLDEPDETEEEILATKWFRFGGSSAWLSKYKIQFLVSRIIYSNLSKKNDPTMSVLHVQVYNRDWRELKNHKIEVLQNDEPLIFPQVLNIPSFQSPANRFGLMGPEDPRVIVRNFKTPKGEEDQEPIVVFNMLDDNINKKRGMHIFKPFAREDDESRFLLLRLGDLLPRKIEKNWIPFFIDDEQDEFLHFMYSIDPLLIVKCSLTNGMCYWVFGPEFDNALQIEDHNVQDIGAMRGGTNLIRIPDYVYDKNRLINRNKQYWIGFPRSHNDNCGCTKVTYRPHMMILSRNLKDKTYKLEYMSTLLDFNMEVLSWEKGKTVCESGKSVMIPNGIAYWDFLKEWDDEEKKATIKDDYMGLIISESDTNIVLIHIRGFYYYVLKILKNLEMKEVAKNSQSGKSKADKEEELELDFDVAEYQNNKMVKCALEDAPKYCKINGLLDALMKDNKDDE